MSNFIKGVKEYRSTSQIEAYSTKVSDWLSEIKENGNAELLLEELISYALKEEKQLVSNKAKENHERIDVCDSINLK